MDDYNRGGRSKYSLTVHIIFVTKSRKKIFVHSKCANDVKQFLYDASKKWIFHNSDGDRQRPCTYVT